MLISFGIMAQCNDTGPAFLLNEIGPTWHPLHITFLLVFSKYPLKFPKIYLVWKSSLVRPSLIPHTACINKIFLHINKDKKLYGFSWVYFSSLQPSDFGLRL